MTRPKGRTLIPNAQELVFCRAYVRLGSARAAAKEADYAFPGEIGYKLLKRPVVRAEIERMRAVVNASRDPVLVAGANEVREKLTWLMRHAEDENIQLKATVSLARLIGMTGEFGLNVPPIDATPLVVAPVDAAGLAQKSTAELVERGKVIALKLLKSGNDG